MHFVGIDPGKKGALALIDPEGKVYIEKMPSYDCPEELIKILTELSQLGRVKVALEKPIIKPVIVPSACPKCKTPLKRTHIQKGVSEAFSSYGFMLGILTMLKIPYEEIAGTVWKKHMKLEKKGKEGSIRLAKQLYPGAAEEIGTDDNKAEAVLIADYCRRTL